MEKEFKTLSDYAHKDKDGYFYLDIAIKEFIRLLKEELKLRYKDYATHPNEIIDKLAGDKLI